MKKPTLLSALAMAAVTAASLTLPATAATASSFNEVNKELRRFHQRETPFQHVHNVERRYNERHHGYNRFAPPRRYRHDNGHHYGHYKHHKRYEYRPVERYRRHHRNDDLRVRIFYDLHL